MSLTRPDSLVCWTVWVHSSLFVICLSFVFLILFSLCVVLKTLWWNFIIFVAFSYLPFDHEKIENSIIVCFLFLSRWVEVLKVAANVVLVFFDVPLVRWFLLLSKRWDWDLSAGELRLRAIPKRSRDKSPYSWGQEIKSPVLTERFSFLLLINIKQRKFIISIYLFISRSFSCFLSIGLLVLVFFPSGFFLVWTRDVHI